MKNLILPGVGKFTILDDRVITETDCMASFFFSDEYIGKSKAEIATLLLGELNPDVCGFYNASSLNEILVDESIAGNFFKEFSLILASNLDSSTLTKLSNISDKLSIPFVAVQAYGLIGTCRLQYKHHEVIESKPEPDLPDLRITYPFEALSRYCSQKLQTYCSICIH